MEKYLDHTGIIFRTHGKESNPLFPKKLQHPVYQLYSPLIISVALLTRLITLPL